MSLCAQRARDATAPPLDDLVLFHANEYRPRRPRLIRSSSRRRRGHDADRPRTGRGDAAATTWMIRGQDADRPRTGRGDAAATTWMIRGDDAGHRYAGKPAAEARRRKSRALARLGALRRNATLGNLGAHPKGFCATCSTWPLLLHGSTGVFRGAGM